MSAELTPYEMRMLEILRVRNPAERIPTHETKNLGQQMADRITRLLGSWHFIIVQSILLMIWIAINVVGAIEHWDPYPFILLNLMLSFQAAYTAPVILMSQNREAEIDRQKLQYYYEVNVKQELEIELMHQKLNDLMEMLTKPVEQREMPDNADL